MKPLKLAGFFFIAAFVVSACTVEVRFEAAGDDLVVNAEWTINGAPATAASCGASGVDEIQLFFYDIDSLEFYTDDTLFIIPCANGSYSSVGPILRHGSYRLQVAAYDATGLELARSGFVRFDAPFPATAVDVFADIPVSVGPGEFNPLGSDVSLSGEWQIDFGGGPVVADATSCTDAKLTGVNLVFLDETMAFEFRDPMLQFNCSDGGFSTTGPYLASGRYYTFWEFLDGGTVVATSETLLLDVTATTNAILATPIYTADLGPGVLRVNLEWDSDPTTGSFVGDTCGGAKVTDLFYSLTDTGGMEVATSGGTIACTEQIIFEEVSSGIYSIYVEGEDTGVKNWMSTCTDMDVAPGEDVTYVCGVEWNGT